MPLTPTHGEQLRKAAARLAAEDSVGPRTRHPAHAVERERLAKAAEQEVPEGGSLVASVMQKQKRRTHVGDTGSIKGDVKKALGHGGDDGPIVVPTTLAEREALELLRLAQVFQESEGREARPEDQAYWDARNKIFARNQMNIGA